MRLLAIIVGCLGVFASGCATIVSGTTQRVPITSVPDGASFTVYRANSQVVEKGMIDETVVTPETASTASAVTPGEAVLRREHDYVVRFQKAGYTDTTVPLCRTRNGNPWVFGNLIFIPGIIVDMMNEPVQHQLESPVSATLTPATGGEAPNPNLICRPKNRQ